MTIGRILKHVRNRKYRWNVCSRRRGRADWGPLELKVGRLQFRRRARERNFTRGQGPPFIFHVGMLPVGKEEFGVKFESRPCSHDVGMKYPTRGVLGWSASSPVSPRALAAPGAPGMRG